MDNEFEHTLRGADDNNPSQDKEIEELQKENASLKIRINEERLLWIITLIVIFDFIGFRHLQGWSSPITIGFFELIIIIILSRRLGIKDITLFTDKLLASLIKKSDI